MTTAYIADTGVFVRCGGPDNEKFQQFRHALHEAGVSLLIPQRVYEEPTGLLPLCPKSPQYQLPCRQ